MFLQQKLGKLKIVLKLAVNENCKQMYFSSSLVSFVMFLDLTMVSLYYYTFYFFSLIF